MSGKAAVVRVDLNVPMKDGAVTDVTRIERILPTLGVVEHESKETFMAMHLSEERKKAWERVAPLLEGKAKPHFYEEIMRADAAAPPGGGS